MTDHGSNTPSSMVANVVLKLVIVNKPPSNLLPSPESGDRPLLAVSIKENKPCESRGQVSNEPPLRFCLIHATPESSFYWVLEEFCRQMRVSLANHKFTLHSQDGACPLSLSACVKDYETLMSNADESVIYVHLQEKPGHFHRTNMPDSKTCHAWIFLAALGLLIGLSGIATLVTLAVIGSLNSEHAVVVDAGSSSSKVQLYSWKQSPSLNAAVAQSGDTCRTKRGVSESEADPEKSSVEIMNCLSKSPFVDVPAPQAPYVNLYLGATAGMRMLSYSNPNATEAILANLRTQLKKANYVVPDANERIRIISGQEEAIGAWITVNYLLEKFGKFINGVFQPQPSSPDETIGSLDLGGASTQITFVPSDSSLNPNFTYDMTMMKLFGQTYHIYGHSYLCYGKHEAEYRQLALMLKKQNFQKNVQNPCIAKNLPANYSAESIFTAPCVRGHFALEAFGEEVVPPANVPDVFHVIGTGDIEQCRKEYVLPFFQSQSFKDVKIPPIRGRFQAFAGFYFVLDHMRLAPSTNLSSYAAGVKRLCETTPSQRDHVAAYKEEFYCFDGVYIEELLKAYGFNENNWDSIEFVDKVRGSGVSWSLGFMIDHSGKLKSEMPGFLNTYFSLGVFIVLLLLLTVIMFCACVFLVGAWRVVRQKSGDTSYAQVHIVTETKS